MRYRRRRPVIVVVPITVDRIEIPSGTASRGRGRKEDQSETGQDDTSGEPERTGDFHPWFLPPSNPEVKKIGLALQHHDEENDHIAPVIEAENQVVEMFEHMTETGTLGRRS